MIRRPPRSTLFPSTPLSRPRTPPGGQTIEENCSRTAIVDRLLRLIRSNHRSIIPELVEGDLTLVKSETIAKAYAKGDRSEEHTSELQSQSNLVCRLLLDKKQ